MAKAEGREGEVESRDAPTPIPPFPSPEQIAAALANVGVTDPALLVAIPPNPEHLPPSPPPPPPPVSRITETRKDK